jgi:hypothetical protein
MKLLFRALAVITLGLVLVELILALASQRSTVAQQQITLTGTVSDSMCGLKHMMTGNDAKCVRSCVKNGSEYALVVDQRIYPLRGTSAELDEFAGQKVTAIGMLEAGVFQVVSVKRADIELPSHVTPSSDTGSLSTTTIIEGLIRDIACPIQNEAATATRLNLKCAQECARLGSPLVVLTNDGVLYTPISVSMPDTDQRAVDAICGQICSSNWAGL